MELTQHPNHRHHNYVILFNDGRIKFGRTGNMRKRLRYYRDVYHCMEGDKSLAALMGDMTEQTQLLDVLEGRA